MLRRGTVSEGENEPSLEGSVLSVAERREKAWFWKKIVVQKNTCTRVHANTHLHIYKPKEKVGSWTQRERKHCPSQVIREPAPFSHLMCFLLTHRTPAFSQTCHPENAAERYRRRQEWSEMLHARTGYHELKDRLYVTGKMSFLRFANTLEFAHWFKS